MGKVSKGIFRVRLIALLVAALLSLVPAFAQNTKPPDRPETARFGDPTGIARQYQGYITGVVKKIDKDEITLEKTRFGVDTTIKHADPVARWLRDVDRDLAKGLTVSYACRKIGIGETTSYRW